VHGRLGLVWKLYTSLELTGDVAIWLYLATLANITVPDQQCLIMIHCLTLLKLSPYAVLNIYTKESSTTWFGLTIDIDNINRGQLDYTLKS